MSPIHPRVTAQYEWSYAGDESGPLCLDLMGCTVMPLLPPKCDGGYTLMTCLRHPLSYL